MIDSLLSGIPQVMLPKQPDMPVYVSEVLSFGAEYRAYIVNHELRGICQYKGSPRPCDLELIGHAVKQFA